jgi:hypothetical protein
MLDKELPSQLDGPNAGLQTVWDLLNRVGSVYLQWDFSRHACFDEGLGTGWTIYGFEDFKLSI